MRPASYIAAAKRLRALADRIEATAHAQTPQERRAQTLAIHAMAQHARHLSERHRRAQQEPQP